MNTAVEFFAGYFPGVSPIVIEWTLWFAVGKAAIDLAILAANRRS